ncbi:hypothetical protein FB45DRAFT_1028051 [Roridomyces roridus]|uniref:Uncharacterized protein n=1 Tax=Roridomyces roridus TaxID=1738132 RepID=A0AAD7FNT9_9AGAR|nr:hypothetical protein FB45DRAFT_1028051 [Roridomyces roridus]
MRQLKRKLDIAVAGVQAQESVLRRLVLTCPSVASFVPVPVDESAQFWSDIAKHISDQGKMTLDVLFVLQMTPVSELTLKGQLAVNYTPDPNFSLLLPSISSLTRLQTLVIDRYNLQDLDLNCLRSLICLRQLSCNETNMSFATLTLHGSLEHLLCAYTLLNDHAVPVLLLFRKLSYVSLVGTDITEGGFKVLAAGCARGINLFRQQRELPDLPDVPPLVPSPDLPENPPPSPTLYGCNLFMSEVPSPSPPPANNQDSKLSYEQDNAPGAKCRHVSCVAWRQDTPDCLIRLVDTSADIDSDIHLCRAAYSTLRRKSAPEVPDLIQPSADPSPEGSCWYQVLNVNCNTTTEWYTVYENSVIIAGIAGLRDHFWCYSCEREAPVTYQERLQFLQAWLQVPPPTPSAAPRAFKHD